MWEPDLNPDGDFGWNWYFKYNNHVPGYSEAQLKGIDSIGDLALGWNLFDATITSNLMKEIIKKIDDCETAARAGPVSVKYFCDVTDAQLAAAKKYTSYFKQGLAVKCTSFVKVNLLHDLR